MLVRKEYNRLAAVDYAKKWALSRNPEYYNFQDIGGNCTNFASQCVFAGSNVMNYTPLYGWYYINTDNRSPSWTGVEFFYNFMINNKSTGPYAEDINFINSEPGDVIQLGNERNFYHSLVVLENNGSEIYIAANTNDALYRPLSTYNYTNIRCIHFLGVFTWV